MILISTAEATAMFMAWGIIMAAAGAALTWLAMRDQPAPADTPTDVTQLPAEVSAAAPPAPRRALPSTLRIVPVIPGRRLEDRTTDSLPRIGDPDAATVIFQRGQVRL